MYYSITFESIDNGQKANTWEDWHLIPSAPPMVSPPEAYTNYVDIPGRVDGPLDLSEVLSDGPVFLNVEGSWDLIWNEDYCPSMTRVEAFRTVTQFLHGKRFRITFEEDPDTSYIGRIQVGDYKVGNAYSTLTLNYIIQPTNNNPLDVSDSNYTSSTGDIPWYTGPVNVGSTGGSSSGSGSGSSSGTGSGTEQQSQYNAGWNAAIDAAIPHNCYYTTSGSYYGQFNQQTQSIEYVLSNAIRTTKYFLPARKSGTTDYDKGWNAALDAAIGDTYYVGASEEATTSLLRNASKVYYYTLPSKK